MADIASLGIVVRTSGVKQAEQDLGRLSKEAARAEASAIKTGSAFGKYLGAGLVLAVGGGLAAIIKNTIEAEKVQAQLAAVLKSTGGAAGLSAKELNKMAASLQAVTTFDDEAITGAQSLLLTFTKIGKDVFPDATKAVLDMSQALGQDLKSSALQLGKALNDPVKGVTALQRVGVAFTAEQKDLIKSLVETGRAADAQRLILAELTTEFGGSAAAARNTLGGALTALKNDFANLLEGDSGGEGIKGTVEAVNDLGETLRSPQVQAGFASMIAGLAKVASFSAQAASEIAGLINAANDIGAANEQKSYLGLLAKRAELQDKIARGGRLSKDRDPLANLLGITNKSAVAEAKKNLVEVEALLARQQGVIQGRFDSKGATAGRRSGANGANNNVRIPNVPASTGNDDAAKGARAAATATRDFAAEEKALQDEMNRASEARNQAIVEYAGLTAALSGPLKQAEFDHIQRLNDIDEAGKAAGKSGEDIARVKALETKRYEEQRDEIEKSLDPIGELLKAKAEELRLMGLGEAAYRTEIDLRGQAVEATAQQREALLALNEQALKQAQVSDAIDSVSQSFQDNFAAVLTGAKSAKEAFADFANSIVAEIAKIIAKKAALALFGEPGSGGAGSTGGGVLSSIFGALFGGGRASGGPVSGSRLYEVGEQNKPELFESNGRQYLIPGNAGKVTPLRGGGGAAPVTIVQNFHGQVSRDVQQQSANRAARQVARAGRGS